MDRFRRRRWRHWAPAACAACLALRPSVTSAQVVHGVVTSAAVSGPVSGAVVLLVDSTGFQRARALTSDSGTFTVGAGAPGRFRLRVMRIGFRPTESAPFELARDTTAAIALTDIPVVLPTVTTRDRSDCRVHPDSTVASFMLWDQAKTALLAAAITLEQRDYRFEKLQHTRLWDTKHGQLRDISLADAETRGSVPWVSLPAEQLERQGFATEDDSGMTFYAPDLDVLLSPYFANAHCFKLHDTRDGAPPLGSANWAGLDFEPARKPRHVEIRGTLWLDSASQELRSLVFRFVNLSVKGADTLLGGRVDFVRLATGAWVLPRWEIRMPTPIRGPFVPASARGLGTRIVQAGSRGRWRLTTDWVRVGGGDLRAVRRSESDTAAAGDSVLWRRPTGAVVVRVVHGDGEKTKRDAGAVLADSALVRLAGSAYGGFTRLDGNVRFQGLVEGAFLFEVTTPVHDALEALPARVRVDVRPESTTHVTIAVKPLAKAAAEVCDIAFLHDGSAVLVGHVKRDSTATSARVTAEWKGGDTQDDARADGYFRLCGVPEGTPVTVQATAGSLKVVRSLVLTPGLLVHMTELLLERKDAPR